MTKEERFWSKADRSNPDGCWPWTRAMHKAHGYGMNPNPKVFPGAYAHRVAYVLTYGPVPDGLQIDHLCRNRACVNPAHLEAVTQRENIRRGERAQQTHCTNGHEFTKENTYINKVGNRVCRTCHRDRESARYHRVVGARAQGRPGYRCKRFP